MPWAQVAQVMEQVEVLHRRLRHPLAGGDHRLHCRQSQPHQVGQIHREVRRNRQEGVWSAKGGECLQIRVQTVVAAGVVHQPHRVLWPQQQPGLAHCLPRSGGRC